MERLKLGFIGAGFISRFQALALQQIRDVDLVGVYSPNTAEDFAAYARGLGLGACKAHSSIAELCNHCDVVAVFSPNYVRLETVSAIVDAVKAGAALKAIVCEKPLARSVGEGRELIEMVEGAGIAHGYFENQLHMNAIKRQMAQLEPQQRAMGPLSLARSAEEHGGPHAPWFWDPTKQGGGALSDMGCHSIAVGWYVLTPPGKPLTFLQPVSVSADVALLKWGQRRWRNDLQSRFGIDFGKTPCEDFATGIITFRNPESGQLVKAQFTNSWMYEKQGLRLFMDGTGPGYAFEINSLQSPLNVFVGDTAADAVADAETALEKSTASRGLLSVMPNEADLYGYTDELADMRDSVLDGRPFMADWHYGLEIVKLCTAAYMSAERGRTIDLTDRKVQDELEGFQSLIAQGRGAEQLQVF